ncbi:MAG: type III pantothenate kinase [Calditrichales bacterium]|nr:MAG: type III pantothenate kinase [Calditrichales bacterium]
MELMVDIGNTNTVLGLFLHGSLDKFWRISSHCSKTEDEIWSVLDSLFKMDDFNSRLIKGVCISSVVPELSTIYRRMVEKYLLVKPMHISPDLNLGLDILYQDPYAVGADRICNAVAGKRKYGTPLIVLDFGTATTFDCINNNGDYLGGVICPGIESAASILHQKAAKLPKIEMVFPSRVIGRNTGESMQSGIMFGSIELIEGMIRRIKKELGGKPKVIATGGLAYMIAKRTKSIDLVDENLNLEGIYQIYRQNILTGRS